MTHPSLGDVAEAIVAGLAVVGALRLTPHFRSRMRLVRDLGTATEEAIAAKAQLLIAEGTVETLRANAEGWRESMERVTGEMERVTGELTELRTELRAQATELVDVKHRLFVAVRYIGELIHHGTVVAQVGMTAPPIPDALRDDLDTLSPHLKEQ